MKRTKLIATTYPVLSLSVGFVAAAFLLLLTPISEKASQNKLQRVVSQTTITPTTPQNAPQKISSFEAYAKWRAEIKRLNNGKLPSHYSMSAVTQRLSENTVEIEFTIVGKMAGVKIIATPLKITRGPDGSVLSEELAGEEAEINQDHSVSSIDPYPMSELTAKIRITGETNSIKLKWAPSEISITSGSTMLVALDSNAVMGITPGQGMTFENQGRQGEKP
ncbi:MAG: hypothetical protein ACRD63_02300 [Pyrinomonadaceae bacterium]